MLVVANWKMNKTASEAKEFLDKFIPKFNVKNSKVVICPPSVDMFEFENSEVLNKIGLGAQNLFYKDKGSFTGETSVEMLKDLKVSYAIIGHSERRNIFAETDSDVNKKIKASLNGEITPIVCVGETLAERGNGTTKQVIKNQILGAIYGINSSNIEKVVFAYEPIWAIGTGKAINPEQADEICGLIKEIINKDVTVLYGGSVNDKNCKQLFAKKNINGALIGGASLDADKFLKIISEAENE